METEKDEQLVRAIQKGDLLCFERLVKRYQTRLFYFTLRILNDEGKAEEVVQDAFFKVYCHIDRVDTRRKFSTYLFEIAKNTALSALRQEKSSLLLNDKMTREIRAPEHDYWERMETVQKVRLALGKIDRKYRHVLRLYYFKDLSYKEIGEKLKIPVNTVRTHLRRARLALKKVFTK